MNRFTSLWRRLRGTADRVQPLPSAGGGAGTGGGTGPGSGGAASRQTDLLNLSKQTKKMMSWLIGLAAAGFLLLIMLAGKQENAPYFLAWSLIAAGAAMVVGGALGLLFGLPTASTVVLTPPAPNVAQTNAASPLGGGALPAANTAAGQTETTTATGAGASAAPSFDPASLGYRESTSLEQVADWLTKIIIGLTLTQYDSWEAKFERLATNLTTALFYGPGVSDTAAPPSPVPGGLLLAFYSIIGFILSYLWMRRFFILEMVTARRDAIEAMTLRGAAAEQRANLKLQEERQLAEHDATRRREQLELDRQMRGARARGLAAPTPEAAAAPSISMDDLKGVLQKAQLLLPSDSKGFAGLTALVAALPEPPPEPDDPWRGKFGGQPSAAGATLEATVSPTSNPTIFKVDLVVRGGRSHGAGTKVLYFLHPTFGLEPRVSILGADDRAPLELYAWGAFTVGALLEDGTKLELNLATLTGAPDLFRTR